MLVIPYGGTTWVPPPALYYAATALAGFVGGSRAAWARTTHGRLGRAAGSGQTSVPLPSPLPPPPPHFDLTSLLQW